jgi:pheromone shutdown protein TraB
MPGSARAQSALSRAVRRAVVDEHQLDVRVEVCERRADALAEDRQRLPLVENRDDDRHGRAGRLVR